MDIKKSLDEALTKKMDRREFLANSGAAALSALGVTAVLGSLGLHQGTRRSAGYGASDYGGKRASR